MITGFSLNGEEYIWTRHPNFPSATAPASACRCCSPTAACRITACTSLTARHTPWRTTACDLCAWDVESVGPDGVTLILESTPLTKFLYPFDFTVLMNYNLEGNTAAINMTVINEGDTNMPFSFGFHPYFKGFQAGECGLRYQVRHLFRERQGRAARCPGKDHPHPQGRCGQQRAPADRRAVPHDPHRQRQRPQGDCGCRRQLRPRRAVAAGCRELCVHGAVERWANSVNEEGKHEVLEPDEAMTADWSITIEKV